MGLLGEEVEVDAVAVVGEGQGYGVGELHQGRVDIPAVDCAARIGYIEVYVSVEVDGDSIQRLQDVAYLGHIGVLKGNYTAVPGYIDGCLGAVDRELSRGYIVAYTLAGYKYDTLVPVNGRDLDRTLNQAHAVVERVPAVEIELCSKHFYREIAARYPKGVTAVVSNIEIALAGQLDTPVGATTEAGRIA